MKKIPMLEKFAVQSLVEYDGELIAVTKIANTGNPEWKMLAKYVLTQGN